MTPEDQAAFEALFNQIKDPYPLQQYPHETGIWLEANYHVYEPTLKAYSEKVWQAALTYRDAQDSAALNLHDAVQALVDELDGLIAESQGVYGLHRNGDPAPWSELIEGGRFERLSSLERVRSTLSQST